MSPGLDFAARGRLPGQYSLSALRRQLPFDYEKHARHFVTLIQGRTSAVERELREINRRTEVGVNRSDEGVERVARLLEEVRLNGTRVEFYA